MYSLTIHAQQVATICYVALSLCETDDEGSTSIIATASNESNLYAALDEDQLWIFLEQTCDAVVKQLSSNETGLWRVHKIDDGLNGGRRGGRAD